jgi:hypothetical protein
MAQPGKRLPGRRRGEAEVIGVVHPLGAIGRAGRQTLWTLYFSFSVWRRTGGGIEEWELFLLRPNLSDAELRRIMEPIEPYDVLRARVRFTKPAAFAGRFRAELTGAPDKESSDAELNARAAQLRRPVTVDHPFFGTFTLDRRLNWYEVAFPWNSRTARLYLSRDGCEDERELFETARSLWRQQGKWDKRIRDYAAAELLDLKNDAWWSDRERKLTPTAFKARMALDSIAVHSGGRFDFDFNYEDGGLFRGHVIAVRGTLAKGPTHAGIAG